MADKHGLNYEVRELKLGASFTNNKASQYHTIKYDFKPASVDVNKMATVDVGTNNQVTVTVPHLDGAGVPHTVFKGSQRPYTKECVLIIDRVTGEITLEKLSSNIQVKKTRQEAAPKPRPLTPGGGGGGGPGAGPAGAGPGAGPGELTNTTQRSSSRTRVATTRRAPPPPHAPLTHNGAGPACPRAPRTPPTMVRSPLRVRTSPPQAPWSSGGNSTLASLPMIGFDEAPPAAPAAAPAAPAPPPAPRDRLPPPDRVPLPDRLPERMPERVPERMPDRMPDRLPERMQERMPERREPPAPQMPSLSAVQTTADGSSSSSSSDSDSGSGSDSDSDDDAPPAPPRPNGTTSLPTDVLNDDLCLSESGSDSD